MVAPPYESITTLEYMVNCLALYCKSRKKSRIIGMNTDIEENARSIIAVPISPG
jgi:hypothetical protein